MREPLTSGDASGLLVRVRYTTGDADYRPYARVEGLVDPKVKYHGLESVPAGTKSVKVLLLTL